MRAKKDWSLWATLGVALFVWIALGCLLTWLIQPVPHDRLSAGLGNVATIGGIVSGLSLSGTAVLTLSGRYKERVAGRFGPAIRFVLFGGFATLVGASLLCALAVLWVEQPWVKALLGFTVPAMFVILIATALLINSAFKWGEPPRGPKASPFT